jgi:hypothetical protein
MVENRRAYRRRVLKSATIEFERSAFSRAVRNISEFGAALDVPSSFGIPHEFQLVCVPKIRFYNIGGEGHQELGVM